jgi:hypothetical protein
MFQATLLKFNLYLERSQLKHRSLKASQIHGYELLIGLYSNCYDYLMMMMMMMIMIQATIKEYSLHEVLGGNY